MTVFDGGDGPLVAFALARLASERPGFASILADLAGRLGIGRHFDDFARLETNRSPRLCRHCGKKP